MSVTLSTTETDIMNVFRAVLLQILPPDTPVIRTQINRVPEPNGDDWVSMTPLFRNRIATNQDVFNDSLFLGNIEGSILSVVKMIQGSIVVDAELSGPGVTKGTLITEFDTGTGGEGRYVVTPSQNIGTTMLSSGMALILTNIDFVVQVDVYGSNSADNVHKIAVLLRDYWGCEAFAEKTFDIQSLYADDPRQMAFVNAEQQYEQRWTVDVHLQVNPVIRVPQQFADKLNITAVPVDVVEPLGLVNIP